MVTVDSLPAYAKMVARTAGVDGATVDQMAAAGKAVEAALAKA